MKFDETYSQQSDVAQFVKFILQANQPSDANAQAAREVLRNWDFKADTQSTGMSIIEYWLDRIDAVHKLDWGRLVGDQISGQVLIDTYVQAADRLQKNFGSVNVPWGQMNRLQRGKVDLARDGGPDMLRASYGVISKDGKVIGDNGDGYIMLVHWDAASQVQAFSIHQFGSATLASASPHYADQSPLYVRRELKQAWFIEADVRAHASQTYRP